MWLRFELSYRFWMTLNWKFVFPFSFISLFIKIKIVNWGSIIIEGKRWWSTKIMKIKIWIKNKRSSVQFLFGNLLYIYISFLEVLKIATAITASVYWAFILQAADCSKCFTFINSLNLHFNLVREQRQLVLVAESVGLQSPNLMTSLN